MIDNSYKQQEKFTKDKNIHLLRVIDLWLVSPEATLQTIKLLLVFLQFV